jgi:hypothetical protein
MRSIAISSGHGKYIRGASGNPVPPQLDEVDSARLLTDEVARILKANGVEVVLVFHDNTSHDVSTNLSTIVNAHNNAPPHDLDVSVHLNCYNHEAHGTECLYKTQKTIAQQVGQAMAEAGDFTLRGDKGAVYRSDLKFLNSTVAPAVLLEVCFCDNTGDCERFNVRLEQIALAIAGALAGSDEIDSVPPYVPPVERPEQDRPTLSKGDYGPDVSYLQEQLNDDNDAGLVVDADFGSATDSAVRNYQASRRLDVDGIVGPDTWSALEADAPAYVPPGLPPPLSDRDIDMIGEIAMNSDIADYNWHDRGVAPPGYTKGFALAFANVYRKLLADHAPAIEMSQARDGSNSKDVLQVYKADFERLGMSNETSGPDTLRHLYALLLGQGMRESSGRHCEGRDMSADNVSSDTAEAGLMQTSYNAHSFHPTFDQLMDEYAAGGGSNPQGFLNVFAEGVYCNSSSWSCYGSGRGYQFQKMAKEQPAFAVETCAVVARNRCDHYGPLIRKECELRPEADEMLMAVQAYIDRSEAVLAA